MIIASKERTRVKYLTIFNHLRAQLKEVANPSSTTLLAKEGPHYSTFSTNKPIK